MEKAMATHSSTLAWKILWAEEPGGLQSVGLQRVGHDWVINVRDAGLQVAYRGLGKGKRTRSAVALRRV